MLNDTKHDPFHTALKYARHIADKGSAVEHLRKYKYALIVAATWGLFFVVLFWRCLEIRPDGLWANHPYVWADWSLHLGLATLFAEKSPDLWFAYHPVFADGQLTYAFLTNWISGMMMRVGFSLPASFILPSIATALLLVAGMYSFYTLVLRSRRKSILAMTLFFAAAGFGFLDFWNDFRDKPALLSFFEPAKNYSKLESYQWFAGNWVTGLLLPQRAMLLGMAMALWSLVGLLSVLLGKIRTEEQRKKILLVSGLLVGFLPIAHMHSLIVLVLLLPGILYRHRKDWKRIVPYYVVPAGVLSSILYLIFVAGKIQNAQFMSWHPFFTARGLSDWLYFWTKAWGILIPVALCGIPFIRGSHKKDLQIFFAGFGLLFVLGNLVYFQPQAWDNSKIFLWCYLGFAGLASHVLYHLWKKDKWLKALAGVLFFLLTATGWLELILVQRYSKNQTRMLSAEEMKLADTLREKTGPLDRFLTGTHTTNMILMRAARPILVGYTGWVFNFGFDFNETLSDIGKIYRGDPQAAELVKKHKVKYIVVSPWERNDMKADASYFLKTYPIAFQTENYLIFDAYGAPPAVPPKDLVLQAPKPLPVKEEVGETDETPSGAFRVGNVRASRFNLGWGSLHRNASVEGHTLAIAGKSFKEGIGTHAKSEVTIDLEAGYKTFTGKVGVDDETERKGSVQFQIKSDHKVLFDSGVVKGGEAAREFKVDVTGLKMVQLVADDGGDGINSDHGDWVDLNLEK